MDFRKLFLAANDTLSVKYDNEVVYASIVVLVCKYLNTYLYSLLFLCFHKTVVLYLLFTKLCILIGALYIYLDIIDIFLFFTVLVLMTIMCVIYNNFNTVMNSQIVI